VSITHLLRLVLSSHILRDVLDAVDGLPDLGGQHPSLQGLGAGAPTPPSAGQSPAPSPGVRRQGLAGPPVPAAAAASSLAAAAFGRVSAQVVEVPELRVVVEPLAVGGAGRRAAGQGLLRFAALLQGAGRMNAAGPRTHRLNVAGRFLGVPLRPGHEHRPGQQPQEHGPHPARHGVRLRRAVVDVQHEDGDHDGERDEDHGEEEVLADQGDDERGGRDGLGDDEEEDGERQQHGDAQRDLLAAVGRQVEDEHGEEGDEEARDDHVDGVEERQPADVQRVRDVRVDLLAAVVLDVVLVAGGVDDGPLAALPEVLEVDGGADEHQVDLGLVVGPRAELHGAVLVVEGEVGDVDLARALEDGRRDPGDVAVVAEVGLGFVVDLEVADRAAERRRGGGERARG